MSRPSREYWESRFAALEALAYGEGTLIYADIEKAYRRAVKDVEKDIALWYLLFSDDEISYSEATKYLTSKELANFKMDVNDYIKSASSAYISTSWAKQLEKVAARHRITRLESIMVQLQQHLEKLFGKQEQLLSEGLARIYNDTYYETAFEVFKGYGIGHEFAGINTDKLEEVLKKPWAPDGSNFPDRVWKHKDVLVNTLAQEMTRAVIRGDDYKTATDNIAEKMNVSRRAAGRLVYTESAYFASKSAINSFKELGVEKYEFIATLDRRTSRTCRNFDGKIFPVKDYKPGRNAPPMHCHCRSHIMPYLEDAHEEERVARGNDGKIYYVPGNMKYKDWKAVYVDKTISLEEWKKKNPNIGLQKSDEGNIINSKRFDFDLQLFAKVPKAENAEIPAGKLTQYVLNTEHTVGGHKARVIKSALGFTVEDAERFSKEILTKVKQQEAVSLGHNGHGEKYKVELPFKDTNGKDIDLTSVWIINDGDTIPKLVTAYIDTDKQKKKRK